MTGSMLNVRHQPDDFMHVKRFTNLDTVHHENNDALSGHSIDDDLDLSNSQMDISDHDNLHRNRKYRSNVHEHQK